MRTQHLDAAELRTAFASYPSGVVAVCGLRGDVPYGMVASSFTSVSLDPPLVSFCVARTSATWPRLRVGGSVGVSVLSTEHRQIGRELGSSRPDRFENVDWENLSNGAIRVRGAVLSLDCEINNEIDAGDHVIVVMKIVSLSLRPNTAPLVFHGSRFTELTLD